MAGRCAACSLALLLLLGLACRNAPPAGEGAQKSIGPKGGSLTSLDGAFTVEVPEGALAQTIALQIFANDEAPPTLDQAYVVRPNVPVTMPIRVTYRSPVIGSHPDAVLAAIDADDYAAGMGHWITLSGQRRDADRIRADDMHLSLYYGLVSPALDGTTGAVTSTSATESGTSTAGTSTGTDETATTGAMTLSHAADIAPIWEQHCNAAGCHSGTAPGGGLDLATDAYAHLIDVPALGAGLPLVDPGAADHSYLLNKLDGTIAEVGGIGSPMPSGQPRLPQETRALIRLWIDQGAAP